MHSNLTLDEMILHYSKNPFVEEKACNEAGPANVDQDKRILSKFLLIAGNLFEKYPASNLSSYKRRYEYE